ncbi:MAG: PilW family protein [Gammaproteobacteria bacterium]|nr:MAG: PilW family protein [Gammaproteobacteria bacterium]
MTLIEIMVAMVIGVIITAAVAQVYATSRATYQLTEGLSRVQENGRFGLEFLTRDVRMAGYSGCLSKTTPVVNHLNNPTDYATDLVLGQHISAHAYTGSGTSTAITDWSPALPVSYFTTGEVLPNTDVLVVRGASDQSEQVLPPYMPTPSAALHIETGNGLKVNDIVIVADCRSADMFQITGPADPDTAGTLNHNTGAVSQGPGNARKDLSKTYDSDAEILKLVTRVYYIGRRKNNPDNPPALFRKELDGGVLVTQELVEGIENLQLYFGDDTDSDRAANIYLTADQVTNWATVVAVRMGLLVRTPDKAERDIDARTYMVAGTLIGPLNDRYQRRVFTSTIDLRN